MYNKAIQGTAEAESSSSLYIPPKIDTSALRKRMESVFIFDYESNETDKKPDAPETKKIMIIGSVENSVENEEEIGCCGIFKRRTNIFEGAKCSVKIGKYLEYDEESIANDSDDIFEFTEDLLIKKGYSKTKAREIINKWNMDFAEVDIDTVKNKAFAKLDTERYGNMEDVEKYIFFHNELYLETLNDLYGQSDLSLSQYNRFLYLETCHSILKYLTEINMEGIENYKNTGLYGNALRKFRDSEELLNYATEEYCFKILDLKANGLITMGDYKAERKVVDFFSERENVIAIINIYTDLMQRKQHEATPTRRLQKNISKSTGCIQAR